MRYYILEDTLGGFNVEIREVFRILKIYFDFYND